MLDISFSFVLARGYKEDRDVIYLIMPYNGNQIIEIIILMQEHEGVHVWDKGHVRKRYKTKMRDHIRIISVYWCNQKSLCFCRLLEFE